MRMRNLLVLSCLALAPLSASAQVPAAVDPYDAAVAASRKLKDGAPATLETLRTMPVELAGVTKVTGYAGEVPNSIREPGLAATLAVKRAYWTGHAHALGARLASLAVHEQAQRRDALRAGLELAPISDSFRILRGMIVDAEKDAVTGHLGRVEAVLADIAADEKGEDGGQALIDRKVALFEKLRR